MWISNTATTLMMIPIAMSVALSISTDEDKPQSKNFTVALLLAVAYSASIGGIGTLVGTPPNLLMAGFLKEQYDITSGFLDWMLFGIPLVLVMLPVCWLVLTRVAFPCHNLADDAARVKRTIADHYAELEQITIPEKRVALVFSCVVALWVLRKWIVSYTGLEGLSDTSIAIMGAMALFIIPSGQGKPLMDWSLAKQLPWDVVLLYGGGMALATVISSSGLATALGHGLEAISAWPLWALIVAVTVMVLLLTELTNNSATIAAFMPILGILAVSADYHPIQLAAPAVMAASCAFMLPVATPPNAIVYGSGQVTLLQMVRGGVFVNVLGLILVPLIAYTMLPLLF